jgi:hypothetical protein
MDNLEDKHTHLSWYETISNRIRTKGSVSFCSHTRIWVSFWLSPTRLLSITLVIAITGFRHGHIGFIRRVTGFSFDYFTVVPVSFWLGVFPFVAARGCRG